MSEEENTTVMDCRIEKATFSTGKQGAAQTINLRLIVDASADAALINLSNLCDNPNKAYAAMKTAVKSAKQIDHEGVADTYKIAFKVIGPANAKDKKKTKSLMGVAHKIRIKSTPEGESVAEVFIRPNYTRAFGLWLVEKLGVDLSATFTLEQSKLDLDDKDTAKNPNK